MVPRGWEGFKAGMARGDPAGGAFEFGAYAPDCEWLPPKEFPGPPVYRGREGFAEFMRAWTEDIDQFTLRLEQLIDTGVTVSLACSTTPQPGRRVASRSNSTKG